MSLIQRLIKGSPLTAKEYDDNNLYLESLANSGGGGGGAGTLEDTLLLGNETLGKSIIISGTDSIIFQDGGAALSTTLVTNTLTGNHTQSLQDKSGVIALLSDIPAATPEFDISINFQSTDDFDYIAPEDFKIVSIDNPDLLTNVITVNGSAYTLGATISQYDKVKITTDGIGFINLNCETI